MLSGLENPIHLLVLFSVVLLLFGAKRLPEIGRGLGTGLRGFKDALATPQEGRHQSPDSQQVGG
jgi:sec-independent protein translocase protein TatA